MTTTYVRKLRTYLIRVHHEETAKVLDQTADEIPFKDPYDEWPGFRQFMISTRLHPFELMDIPDIFKIVALDPYRCDA